MVSRANSSFSFYCLLSVLFLVVSVASIDPLDPPPTPPPLTSTHSSTLTQVPISFSHQITEKLNDKNFLLWHQQVEPVIMVHHFVVDPQVPSRFLTNQNCDVNHVNP